MNGLVDYWGEEVCGVLPKMPLHGKIRPNPTDPTQSLCEGKFKQTDGLQLCCGLILSVGNGMITRMNDIPSRDEELFTEALGLPAGQRTAFLEGACGSDDALRQRVR